MLTFPLIAILASNVFAHSLLLTPFFFLTLIILSRLNIFPEKTPSLKKPSAIFALIICFVTFPLATREVIASFGKTPFHPRYICFKKQDIFNDRHASGFFRRKVFKSNDQLKLEVSLPHADIQRRPVEVSIKVSNPKSLYHESYATLTDHSKLEKVINLSRAQKGEELYLDIIVSRCYVPKNLGVSNDNRRLGVKIHQLMGVKPALAI